MAKNDTFGDERLRKNLGDDVRGTRDAADAERTQQDGLALSAAERRKLLREEWVQEVLPTVTPIPGQHFCWLSTTNGQDPIHRRIQLGYTPVKANEVQGFEQFRQDGGQFDGCITCNEMVLFKVSQERYNDLMMIYHHEIPLEQEQAIKERVKGMTDVDSSGHSLSVVEGDFDRLGKTPVRPPQFA
jgi:hypothetical protein